MIKKIANLNSLNCIFNDGMQFASFRSKWHAGLLATLFQPSRVPVNKLWHINGPIKTQNVGVTLSDMEDSSYAWCISSHKTVRTNPFINYLKVYFLHCIHKSVKCRVCASCHLKMFVRISVINMLLIKPCSNEYVCSYLCVLVLAF